MARDHTSREASPTSHANQTKDSGGLNSRPPTEVPSLGSIKPAIGFIEHLRFFDRNQDQRLSLEESWTGLEQLGFGHLLSRPGALGIGIGLFGLGLLQGRFVNPVSLQLPKTAKVRHPDTELIDADGNFVEARLDALFDRYARTFPGEALTFPEMLRLIGERALHEAGRNLGTALLLPLGLGALAVEWGALFLVASVERGGLRVLEKETVRRFYTDDKFFEEVAARIQAARARRGRTLLGSARNALQDWVI